MPPKKPKKKKTAKLNGRPCTTEEICKFLKDLSDWLVDREKDYQKLRIAMCNVEAKAFDGAGVPTKRFCPPGGPGGDPIAPPPPPKWT